MFHESLPCRIMSRALQVYLEDTEFQLLQHWAEERGWTLSNSGGRAG